MTCVLQKKEQREQTTITPETTRAPWMPNQTLDNKNIHHAPIGQMLQKIRLNEKKSPQNGSSKSCSIKKRPNKSRMLATPASLQPLDTKTIPTQSFKAAVPNEQISGDLHTGDNVDTWSVTKQGCLSSNYKQWCLTR